MICQYQQKYLDKSRQFFMMLPNNKKFMYYSPTNRQYEIVNSFLKLDDLSSSTFSKQFRKDSASSDDKSQTSFQTKKSGKTQSCNQRITDSQKQLSHEPKKCKLKSCKSMDIGFSELQKLQIKQASVVTKTSFKRYIGSMQDAKIRLQSHKDQKYKQQKTANSELTIQCIVSKQYLTVSQKILIQSLNETLEKLNNSQAQKQKLLSQRFELESELRLIRSDMLEYQQRLKWYQTYSEQKDFQAKALYWKQYFKDLNQKEKKCNQLKQKQYQ